MVRHTEHTISRAVRAERRRQAFNLILNWILGRAEATVGRAGTLSIDS